MSVTFRDEVSGGLKASPLSQESCELQSDDNSISVDPIITIGNSSEQLLDYTPLDASMQEPILQDSQPKRESIITSKASLLDSQPQLPRKQRREKSSKERPLKVTT